MVLRICGSANIRCSDGNIKEICDKEIKKGKLKSCHGECCKTDNCNNYTPSVATGIMATKFALFLTMFTSFMFA